MNDYFKILKQLDKIAPKAKSNDILIVRFCDELYDKLNTKELKILMLKVINNRFKIVIERTRKKIKYQ